MSDKHLGAKEWQKFAAGRGYKDAALVKALVAAEKAGDDPAQQLPALDVLEAAARELLKQHKADKGLDGYVENLLKAVRNQRKEAEKAAEADDEDSKGDALLDPKRLLQQLTLCRKDPERTVQFAFVDARDKSPAVLAMNPKVAGRKLFALLGDATGVKTGAYGSAWVDGQELMLQLDKPLGGLVKKLRQPVKDCGFRVTRIVLWNADGTVFEADDEREAAPAGASSAPADAAPAIPPAPPLPGAATATATAPRMPSPDEAAFTARLKALLPRIAALGEAAEGRAAKLLASEAGVLLRKGDAAAANANLDKVERLLQRVGSAGPAGAPAPAAAPAAAASGGPSPGVRFTQTRLAWDATRKQLRAELQKVEQAILAETASDPDHATYVANIQVIYTPLDRLDERLIDVLDDALNADDDAQRREHRVRALSLVDEYLAYVNGDDAFLSVVNDNGFAAVDIVPMLQQRLGDMRRQLEQAVAA